MRRELPELTDEDLRRLAQLGGGVEQIAEAAGIDAQLVSRRLASSERRSSDGRPTPVFAAQTSG